LAGRIDEAAGHTQKALALTRLRARGNEAHALCLNGDIAAAAGAATLRATTARRWRSPSPAACVRLSPIATYKASPQNPRLLCCRPSVSPVHYYEAVRPLRRIGTFARLFP
jgi:hypothetical protein